MDGVFDGEDLLIPGIMEHVDAALDCSGDSISVYPPIHVEDKHKQTIEKYTYDLAKALGVIGLINIQFIIYNDEVYVIEVNPRSSRTIPYISKVTGVPIIDLATKVMLGQKLKDLGYGTGIYKQADYYAVKMPVFSFEKLTDVDTGLGPEMKSTGEVLGLAESFPQALLKPSRAPTCGCPRRAGRIIITVKDEDKREIVGIARGFADMGIEILATDGTCKVLQEAGVPCTRVKPGERGPPQHQRHDRLGHHRPGDQHPPPRAAATTPTASRSAGPRWSTPWAASPPSTPPGPCSPSGSRAAARTCVPSISPKSEADVETQLNTGNQFLLFPSNK